MAKDNLKITVEGLESTEAFFDALEPALRTRIPRGLRTYIKRNLVPRIKKRLSQATQSKNYTPNPSGAGAASGGYGTPKNAPGYKEWKDTRVNLPQVGGLSTREFVATGHFVESIALTKVDKVLDRITFEVGPTPGPRPSAKAFSDDGTGGANISKVVENTELAEWLEDSDYKFWATEYEDVVRDIHPVLTRIIVQTIRSLVKAFSRMKK